MSGADKFTDATKLKDVGRFLPRVFSLNAPKRLALWYHRKYVLTNRINPFAHVFFALSAFGWYMHESKWPVRAQKNKKGKQKERKKPPLRSLRSRLARQAATDTRRSTSTTKEGRFSFDDSGVGRRRHVLGHGEHLSGRERTSKGAQNGDDGKGQQGAKPRVALRGHGRQHKANHVEHGKGDLQRHKGQQQPLVLANVGQNPQQAHENAENRHKDGQAQLKARVDSHRRALHKGQKRVKASLNRKRHL